MQAQSTGDTNMSYKSNTFNKVTRKFSFRLPLELDAALEKMMAKEGYNKASLVIDAISQYIDACKNADNRA
jgi:predicted DNA-binding protein